MQCIHVEMFGIAAALLSAGMSGAQEYPNKPIHIITSPAGGGADFAARLIAQGISSSLGQPVVVDNRPSNLIGEIAAKAPPDGYTLLLAGGTFLIVPLLQKTSYDPVADFTPISTATSQPNFLVVHPSLPVKSVKELIVLAKARPGQLNYASGSPGGSSQLTAELFKHMASVNIVLVPYKGSAQSINDLLSGEVQVTFESATVVMPLVKRDKLRALAVTTAQPTALAPELPTIAATLPGFESVQLAGVYGRAKTPAAIIERLSQEVVRVLNRPDVKEKLLTIGVEAASSSPEQLAARVKSEMAKWSKVIKDAGIKG